MNVLKNDYQLEVSLGGSFGGSKVISGLELTFAESEAIVSIDFYFLNFLEKFY